MPKMKTRKAVSERIEKTKKNKYRRRRAGQSHFNARDRGKDSRRKRRDITISKAEKEALDEAMPYNS